MANKNANGRSMRIAFNKKNLPIFSPAQCKVGQPANQRVCIPNRVWSSFTNLVVHLVGDKTCAPDEMTNRPENFCLWP